MEGRQSKKSPLSGKIKFAKSKGRKPRLEQVELESGRIEVPEFAILDGNVQTIETKTKEAGGKRTLDFIFPYFSDSLVYDPLVEIHTDEEKSDFISRVQDLYDAAQAERRQHPRPLGPLTRSPDVYSMLQLKRLRCLHAVCTFFCFFFFFFFFVHV